MKKWFPENEFYVGYIPQAPKGIAAIVRKVILFLIFSMLVVVVLLTWQQKKFSPHTFEYGMNTEVVGYIFNKPVPHLLMPLGKDIRGKELYQTVLLVGFGKAGAGNFIQQIASSEGNKVGLNGFLIYGNGKALLQVSEESAMQYSGDRLSAFSMEYNTEPRVISGEIVDPKCYFGVMKPGEGKAHRSCAIRCIAGGIPPVLSSDSSGYFLLVNERNEPISTEIVNIVGDHITLTGEAMQWNDWTILQIDSEKIRQLSAVKKWKETLFAFEKGMTQCN